MQTSTCLAVLGSLYIHGLLKIFSPVFGGAHVLGIEFLFLGRGFGSHRLLGGLTNIIQPLRPIFDCPSLSHGLFPKFP